MTPEDFQAELRGAGLTGATLRDLIEGLSGHRPDRKTTYNWTAGARAVPPLAVALVRLFARQDPETRAALLAKPRRTRPRDQQPDRHRQP